MNTKLVLAGILLTGSFFAAKAQTIVETNILTSGGLNAGTTGSSNTFYGVNTGKVNTTGSGNTFVGQEAGQANTTGGSNSFIGQTAGYSNTTGFDNVYVGYQTGATNKTGTQNAYLGNYAGGGGPGMNLPGSGNTFLGYDSGHMSTGSNNVLIGKSTGYALAESNKLYIDNTNTATPLIWGDFAADLVKLNGKVGIGGVTTFPSTANGTVVSGYKLFVKGGILTEAVRVTLQSQWADYVFTDDYALPSLNDVECFIAENGHLPNVPSAKQIAQDGLELAEMAKIQQEKIEELTLYAINQNKKIEKLEQQLEELQELKAIVKQLADKK